jgi:hypothetical protein
MGGDSRASHLSATKPEPPEVEFEGDECVLSNYAMDGQELRSFEMRSYEARVYELE